MVGLVLVLVVTVIDSFAVLWLWSEVKSHMELWKFLMGPVKDDTTLTLFAKVRRIVAKTNLAMVSAFALNLVMLPATCYLLPATCWCIMPVCLTCVSF